MRYSGDPGGNCPYALIFENNIFHYPYCWPDKEDCNTARAILCSISNKESCGEDACWNDSTKVLWINNDIKYRWEPDTTATNIDVSSQFEDFEIKGIMPNPTNGSTTLQLILHKASSVKVSVLNIQGQVIFTPFVGKMISGEHAVQLNFDRQNQSANMSTGIYICQVLVDNTVEYRKVIYAW